MAANLIQLREVAINGIQISATSSPGTTIDTVDATDFDHLYIFAVNNHTADVTFTLEWGGTGVTQLEYKLSFQSGLFDVSPGIPLTGGLVVKGFASVTNVVNVFVYSLGITA